MPPDFVKVHQPVKKFFILNGRKIARKGLVEMMMSVDKAGQRHTTPGIYHRIRFCFYIPDLGKTFQFQFLKIGGGVPCRKALKVFSAIGFY